MQQLLRSVLVAGVAVLGFTACSDDDGGVGPDNRAAVRVVHLSPNAGAVNVLLDDATVQTAIAYNGAANYYKYDRSAIRVRVAQNPGGTVLIDSNIDVEPRSFRTVIATGLVANIQPLVLVDDPTHPAAGNVRVRVAHAAPSAAGVDVYVTAVGADIAALTPTLSNIAYRTASAYLEIPAGTYQIRVTPTGTKTVAINVASLALVNGQVRTIVARDAVGGGAPLATRVLSDLR